MRLLLYLFLRWQTFMDYGQCSTPDCIDLFEGNRLVGLQNASSNYEVSRNRIGVLKTR